MLYCVTVHNISTVQEEVMECDLIYIRECTLYRIELVFKRQLSFDILMAVNDNSSFDFLDCICSKQCVNLGLSPVMPKWLVSCFKARKT